jgi:hypothetical protein
MLARLGVEHHGDLREERRAVLGAQVAAGPGGAKVASWAIRPSAPVSAPASRCQPACTQVSSVTGTPAAGRPRAVSRM